MKNPLLKRMARQMLRSPGKVLPIFLAMLFIIVFTSSFFYLSGLCQGPL